MNKRNTLGIVVASTILAAGCGGGGSGSGTTNNNDGADAGGGTPDTADFATVSGRAADGYLVQANVCADLNANARCDAGEPNTTTGEGGQFTLEIPVNQLDTELVVEVIANLTVDEDTMQPVPKGYTLRSPILGRGDNQFVSPMSTLLADEMRATGATSAIEAKNKILRQLGVTFDLTSDFVAASKDDSSPGVQREAQKLHRMAQVFALVMAEFEDGANQSVLDQAGLTKAEFLDQVTDQLNGLIPSIVSDVAEAPNGPDFDPGSLVAKYNLQSPLDDQADGPGTEQPGADSRTAMECFNPELYQEGTTFQETRLYTASNIPEVRTYTNLGAVEFNDQTVEYQRIDQRFTYSEDFESSSAFHRFYDVNASAGEVTYYGTADENLSNAALYAPPSKERWNLNIGETREISREEISAEYGFAQTVLYTETFLGFETITVNGQEVETCKFLKNFDTFWMTIGTGLVVKYSSPVETHDNIILLSAEINGQSVF
ncbi:hypothetical protein Q667_17575 [Marinobacter sp. C1S70]|uniref:hypothetical protein n=1 Tax=Marinobacter sp. C1S70 TaxID=1396859 RepID=UPI0003B83E64|nr:hypothetical protein [Marinobacter sp. C1S70]ERS85194.1 hypothetical protein Q667_17575 [Marinobacter sp. C1S70]